MNRKGFALLTALWLVVLVGAAVAGGLADGRVAVAASRNRLRLLRAEWARDACAEIARQRLALEPTRAGLEPVDLGGGASCEARIDRPAARLSLNHASADMLVALFGDSSLADALLDWRDADTVARPHGAERAWYLARGRRPPRDGAFAEVAELRFVRGFEGLDAGLLGGWLTTRSDGLVDLTLAPREVLASLPGVTWGDAERLHHARNGGADAAILGALARDLMDMAPAASELGRIGVAGSPLIVVRVTGRVAGSRLRAEAVLTLRVTGGRAAIVHRELL